MFQISNITLRRWCPRQGGSEPKKLWKAVVLSLYALRLKMKITLKEY